MDEQPNLQQFLNEVSSFSGRSAGFASEGAGGPAPTADRPGRRNRRLGLADPHGRRRAGGAAVARRPVGRHVGPGRQPGQDDRRQQLADRQRPHAARRRRRRDRRPRRLPRRRQPSDSAGKLSNFRRGVTRYPIPGCEVLPVTTEDLRAIFAAERRAAHRDRHRLSDRRHPRRALRRSDAVEAFRGAGIDRYR